MKLMHDGYTPAPLQPYDQGVDRTHPRVTPPTGEQSKGDSRLMLNAKRIGATILTAVVVTGGIALYDTLTGKDGSEGGPTISKEIPPTLDGNKSSHDLPPIQP